MDNLAAINPASQNGCALAIDATAGLSTAQSGLMVADGGSAKISSGIQEKMSGPNVLYGFPHQVLSVVPKQETQSPGGTSTYYYTASQIQNAVAHAGTTPNGGKYSTSVAESRASVASSAAQALSNTQQQYQSIGSGISSATAGKLSADSSGFQQTMTTGSQVLGGYSQLAQLGGGVQAT